MYRINEPRFIFQEVESEIIAVDLENGNYYSLNKAASLLWKVIAAGTGTEDLETFILRHYPMLTETWGTDLARFIASARAEAMIVSCEKGETAREAEAILAAAGSPDEEPPAFEKFEDMKEFLLVDPIHEVNIKGWPHKRDAEENK